TGGGRVGMGTAHLSDAQLCAPVRRPARRDPGDRWSARVRGPARTAAGAGSDPDPGGRLALPRGPALPARPCWTAASDPGRPGVRIAPLPVQPELPRRRVDTGRRLAAGRG